MIAIILSHLFGKYHDKISEIDKIAHAIADMSDCCILIKLL